MNRRIQYNYYSICKLYKWNNVRICGNSNMNYLSCFQLPNLDT